MEQNDEEILKRNTELVRRFEERGISRDDLELFLQLDDPELRKFFAGLRERAHNVLKAHESKNEKEKVEAFFRPYINESPIQQIMDRDDLPMGQAATKLFQDASFDSDSGEISDPGKWFKKAPFSKAEFGDFVNDHQDTFEVLAKEDRYQYTEEGPRYYIYTNDGVVIELFPVRSHWAISSGLEE